MDEDWRLRDLALKAAAADKFGWDKGVKPRQWNRPVTVSYCADTLTHEP